MSAKKVRYSEVEKTVHVIFLEKAASFYRAMSASYRDENWYSVGLEAVHCAISATDVLLAKKCGIKSTGKDHMDVIRLMQDKLGNMAKDQTATLSRIINMKNQVEYQDRIFTRKEAEEILARTSRYYGWVKEIISG